MMVKYTGEEQIRYLLLESHVPTIDIVMNRISVEQKRRQVDAEDPLQGPVYLNSWVYRQMLRELKSIGMRQLPFADGKFYFNGFWFASFFLTDESHINTNVEYIMFIDEFAGRIRGL